MKLYLLLLLQSTVFFLIEVISGSCFIHGPNQVGGKAYVYLSFSGQVYKPYSVQGRILLTPVNCNRYMLFIYFLLTFIVFK